MSAWREKSSTLSWIVSPNTFRSTFLAGRIATRSGVRRSGATSASNRTRRLRLFTESCRTPMWPSHGASRQAPHTPEVFGERPNRQRKLTPDLALWLLSSFTRPLPVSRGFGRLAAYAMRAYGRPTGGIHSDSPREPNGAAHQRVRRPVAPVRPSVLRAEGGRILLRFIATKHDDFRNGKRREGGDDLMPEASRAP